MCNFEAKGGPVANLDIDFLLEERSEINEKLQNANVAKMEKFKLSQRRDSDRPRECFGV